MERSLRQFGRGNPSIPAAVFGPLGMTSMVFSLSSSDISVSSALGLYLGGLFVWTIAEYTLHRFSFHSKSESMKDFTEDHGAHHSEPASRSYLVAPLTLSVPVYLILFAFFYTVTWNFSHACFLSAGLITGYLAYEWVHYSTHHRTPRNHLERYLKKYHMAHHFKDEGAFFGVTTPFWDIVFGTKPSFSANPTVPARKAG